MRTPDRPALLRGVFGKASLGPQPSLEDADNLLGELDQVVERWDNRLAINNLAGQSNVWLIDKSADANR